MLIDNIPDIKIKYELILCKPDETELVVLNEAYNINIKAKFPTTDELNFDIPYYININNLMMPGWYENTEINLEYEILEEYEWLEVDSATLFVNELFNIEDVYSNNANFANYDLIQGDYLVLLNKINEYDEILESKYFIINTTNDIGDSKEIKSVQCYSREYELNKKIIRDYKLVSRKLYSPTNEIDSDGFQLGIMNYITTLTSWSLDVDSFISENKFIESYRAFDISEKTLFDFLINDVQKSYSCIFLFDTKNKKISAKLVDNLISNKGLYINEDNYIKKINKEIKHDEIITRLYCYGKDDIVFNTINPTGVPYVENFDFYKTTEFMSTNLINALNNYKVLLQYHEGNNTFNNLNSQYLLLLDDKRTLLNERNILFNGKYVFDEILKEEVLIEDGLYQIQDKIDVAINNNSSLTVLNGLLYNKELEILNKQAHIDKSVFINIPITTINVEIFDILKKHPTFNYSGIISKEEEINNKLGEISNFRWLISKNNPANFTSNNLVELDYFVREQTWTDSTYETPEDLYEEAKNQILKLCTPPLNFNINVVDFLRATEGKVDRNKLILGDIVNIGFEKFGVDIQVRLVGYDYNIDSNNLSLSFSNKDNLDNPYLYLVELQKNAITTSTTIDMSKYKWDKSEDNVSAINDIINNNIDTTYKKVMAGKNQDIEVGRRGIWLREKNEDGSYKPEQVRMINNAIVLSDDGFQSAKTAITPFGVNAALLMGKTIIGQQGLFDGINIFDGGQNPVVEIGKYLDGIEEKKGIRINSGVFNLIGGVNGVNINPSEGIVVNKIDGLVRTVLNATEGIKIQKRIDINTEWNDTHNKLYFDVAGNLKFSGTLDGVNGDFSGSINATSGTIGGWGIGVDNIIGNSSSIIIGGKIQNDINASKTKLDLNNGIFRLGSSDVDYKLKFDGTDLIFGSGVLKWENLDSQTQTNLTGPPGADGASGVSVKVSYIFLRSISQPTTPTGGTYASPVPSGWYDAPPAGTNPLYMSKRNFYSDGTSDASWSTPVKIDGNSIKAQYSIDGFTNWHDTFVDGDIYMRQSVDGGATWTSVIRIVGEKGEQGVPGVDGSYYAPSYLGPTEITSTTIISPQITGGTGRFRDTIYIGADDGTYNKAGISALGNLPTSIRFWAGDATPSSAPFRVTQDGSTTLTKFNLLSTSPDINNSYIDMYGSKIEGGKLDVKNPYYVIGTTVFSTGSRSGIFRSNTFLNDNITTIDYIMDVTHNTIMVKGSNLVLGGQGELRSVVITRQVEPTLHRMIIPQNAALHVIGNINFTGDLYKNGNPFTVVAKFA